MFGAGFGTEDLFDVAYAGVEHLLDVIQAVVIQEDAGENSDERNAETDGDRNHLRLTHKSSVFKRGTNWQAPLVGPRFDGIRGEPRYQDLLRRMRLVP